MEKAQIIKDRANKLVSILREKVKITIPPTRGCNNEHLSDMLESEAIQAAICFAEWNVKKYSDLYFSVSFTTVSAVMLVLLEDEKLLVAELKLRQTIKK